ncbi:SRPBCC family protein [Antarctobacter jejuensis]|uniref:SRPBCC family protein n=1 Tax=Antarctobacter jejuensis TaxID=1439938 RepID=UPI003FD049F4
MELKASEDIEASQDQVFAALSDFDMIERQALRRGVDIMRMGEVTGAGMAWRAKFTFRGKKREAEVRLVTFDAPDRMTFHSVSGGLETDLEIDVVALSRNRTRINMVSVMHPKTLSARLLVQSLKLAKGGVEKRFRRKMAELATGLETRLRGVA